MYIAVDKNGVVTLFEKKLVREIRNTWNNQYGTKHNALPKWVAKELNLTWDIMNL